MADMDIEATKLELIQLVLQTQKKSVLEQVKSVFQAQSGDWWDDLTDQDKKEIKLGLQDLENENVYDHEQVKEIFSKWSQK